MGIQNPNIMEESATSKKEEALKGNLKLRRGVGLSNFSYSWP
jgi:hypothetical protein